MILLMEFCFARKESACMVILPSPFDWNFNYVVVCNF
jgi:hypothetical protein